MRLTWLKKSTRRSFVSRIKRCIDGCRQHFYLPVQLSFACSWWKKTSEKPSKTNSLPHHKPISRTWQSVANIDSKFLLSRVIIIPIQLKQNREKNSSNSRENIWINARKFGIRSFHVCRLQHFHLQNARTFSSFAAPANNERQPAITSAIRFSGEKLKKKQQHSSNNNNKFAISNFTHIKKT